MDDLLAFEEFDLKTVYSRDIDESNNKSNLNEGIIDMLKKLITKAKELRSVKGLSTKEKTSQSRRIISFSKALDVIKDHDTEITSGRQAVKLPSIGKGIADRIDEYLKTGTLAEFDKDEDIRAKSIMELCTVTGIGEARAQLLYDNYGVKNVPQLIEMYKNGQLKIATNQLTEHIAVGLDYYYDLQTRMPWKEADKIGKRIKRILTTEYPHISVHICGSYRRKLDTCGDIDVLVSNTAEVTLSDIVSTLETRNPPVIVASLTHSHNTKFMGICKSMNPDALGRRIDIRYIEPESLGAALLYFTGSGKFNTIMRYEAQKRGYKLNEYGLRKLDNTLIASSTEEEIFKVLHFKYIPPEER